MAKKPILPQSINLLDPVLEPEDIWVRAYKWVTRPGRYILVFIEMLVLAVFIIRFIYDKQRNDLTDEINGLVENVLTLPDIEKDEQKLSLFDR